ncbi:MAG: type IV pilus assembly protein PilB [Flavobacteriaceae bacterium]|jgi:type IV pilus assembly protein PilB
MLTFDDSSIKKIADMKLNEEEELVQILAEAKYDLPYINLAGALIENEALRYVDEEDAKKYEVAPFKVHGKDIYLAIRSPMRPGLQKVIAAIERKKYKTKIYMASQASIQKIIDRYDEISKAEQVREGGIDITGTTVASIGKQIHTMGDVSTLMEQIQNNEKKHRISKLIEVIMGAGISLGASDVHIEPEEDYVRIRYRLDGLLQDVHHLEHQDFRMIAMRIKLLSSMKISSTATAQDGRFAIELGDVEVSIRTSTVPSSYGEGIVMRILNPKATKVGLEQLGIPEKLYNIIIKEIARPNGMVLLTGPTGSGKTTTLYSFLRKIHSEDIKMITIENPVEYKLEGITQTQTDHKKGYTFLSGLRAALRQDPDVIMVGEIRDPETAQIAVQSALTGHMVFSTLHTNNAQGVIPRLIDLKINPKIIASALTMAIGQRLVRKICENCKTRRLAKEDEREIIFNIYHAAKNEGKNFEEYGVNLTGDIYIYEGKGCTACNNFGYKGRIGIYEAIVTDEAIETILPQNPSEREIKKIAEKQGILDMKEDGIVKVLLGVTSLSEVGKVVNFDED